MAAAVALAVAVSSGSAAAGTIGMASGGGNWKWHDAFGFENERLAVGDFNGDGRDDIVTFQCGQSGDVFVALSNGKSFEGTGVKWNDNICFGNDRPLIGDVDGDRDDDIVLFTCGQGGDVFVAFSNRRGFEWASAKWHDDFCFGDELPMVGDFNGDGRADIVSFKRGGRPDGGDVFVALSTGSSFAGTGQKWHDAFAYGNEQPAVGDFDDDGDDDIAAFQCGNRPNGGQVYVALSDRRSFQGTGLKWHDAFCFAGERPAVGDFYDDGSAGRRGDIFIGFDYDPDNSNLPGTVSHHDGDGKDDLVAFQCGQSGDVFVAHSTGRAFEGTGAKWHEDFCFGDDIPLIGDFNGDGKDDIVAFARGERPYGGDVSVALSIAWSPNFQNDRRFYQGFTQLSAGDCTKFLRAWGRRLAYEDPWRMANCEWVLGLRQYCDRSNGFLATKFYNFRRLPTDTTDTTARYMTCEVRQGDTTVFDDIERIGVGVAQGVATAFVAAAPFLGTAASALGCVKGVIYACVTLALDVADYAGLRVLPELREAVAIADHATSCINGDITACAKLGARGARAAGVTIPGLDAVAAANAQACAGGDFGACARLGLAAAAAGGVPLGLGPQQIADVQDCLNGVNEACLALGSSAAQAAAQATGFPLNGVLQGAANAAQCSRGDAAACVRLGKGLVGSSVAGDAQAVAQCGVGDTNACIKLAKQLVGSGLGQGVARAEQCAQNDTAACIALGRSLVALVRS